MMSPAALEVASSEALLSSFSSFFPFTNPPDPARRLEFKTLENDVTGANAMIPMKMKMKSMSRITIAHTNSRTKSLIDSPICSIVSSTTSSYIWVMALEN
jgi:hypothetical protein